jgi:hypothetical protein
LFKNEGRTTIAKAIDVFESYSDEDIDLVLQSFGLLAFGTVLCPGTDNTVKCEYLGSLMDMAAFNLYTVDEHILSEVMGEVELFKEKMIKHAELDKIDNN